jgi:hypothetical protein
MIQIPFEGPQKRRYLIILEMSWEMLPGLADGGPSVCLWNLRTFKSRTDWCLASRVDEELWKSSDDGIHRQLDANCGTSSCPYAQIIDHCVLLWKMLLLIKQRWNHVLNEIFLVSFLPVREGIQDNQLSRCERHPNHNFLIEIPGLSLGITSSHQRANIESDSIR